MLELQDLAGSLYSPLPWCDCFAWTEILSLTTSILLYTYVITLFSSLEFLVTPYHVTCLVLNIKSAGFSAAADATRVSVVIGLFKVRPLLFSEVQYSKLINCMI